MMGALSTEIRRSPGLVAFPLLVAVNVGATLQDASYWAGDWHATSIQAQYSNVLVGPFIAACAAWAAGRERRNGHTLLAVTMPRLQWGPIFMQWTAVTFWGLLTYGIGLVVASFVTSPNAVSDGLWPSYISLGAAAVCAYSAIGYGLGQLLGKWRVVVPLVAISTYAYFAILSLQGSGLNRLGLVYGDILASPQFRLRASVVGIGLLWAAALVIAALALGSTRRMPFARRAPLMALALLPVVGSVLAASFVEDGDFVQRMPPENQVCEGRMPQVCVWPEHAKWADDAAGVAHGLATALDGVAYFPPTIYEEGLPEAPLSDGAVVRVNTIPMTPPSFVTGLAAGVMPEFPPRCSTHVRYRLETYILIKAWMETRAAGRLGPDVYTDGADLQILLSLNPSEQKAWVRENLPAAVDCSEPAPPPSLSSLQASRGAS